ncbi:MAG TPA: hypothetical protein VGX69_02700 [Solirubrobacteraceae bacterium]|nr:hypothetical protein [Solirubrobacteraceae bacterium]
MTEPRLVFRFLKQPDKHAPDFADNFKSDEERGKKPVQGEHPDLGTGMSAFVSEAAARKRWAEIKSGSLKKRSEKSERRQKGRPRPFKMSIGDYVGEVLLISGAGFEFVDLNEPDGHLTIRGEKNRLAAQVADVYPAETSQN